MGVTLDCVLVFPSVYNFEETCFILKISFILLHLCLLIFPILFICWTAKKSALVLLQTKFKCHYSATVSLHNEH